MLIEKVINNNIVSAFDDTGREVVVMGRGLGFGVRPGQPVNEKKIEKVFRICEFWLRILHIFSNVRRLQEKPELIRRKRKRLNIQIS